MNTAPRNLSPASVIGRLNLEWQRLHEDEETNAVVASWAAQDARLEGLGSLAAIEEANAGKVDERIDAMFYALVSRAVHDVGPAARIVLQLMLPKVVLIARRYTQRFGEIEERRQLALDCMWEQICTFPVDMRRHHVPCHLAWDTKRAVHNAVVAETTEIPTDLLGDMHTVHAPANASEELLVVLVEAVRDGVITAEEANLIGARYSGGTEDDRTTWRSYGNLSVIAATTRLTPDAVKKRCSRIRHRLIEARHDSAA